MKVFHGSWNAPETVFHEMLWKKNSIVYPSLYSSYEKRLLIGDFYTETSKPRIDSFIYEHDLHNLVKEKTCFKSVENPSCIDLILTNNAMAFQNTTTVFTGLSDFHKLVLTVLRTSIT